MDRTEFVYVTQFGQHVATFDGDSDAGWHWKLPWPIQSVQRLDHRLQVFDLPETEVLTRDRQTVDKTLTVGAYVCWRIADSKGVDQFIRAVGTPERARAILGQQVSSRLGAAISTMPITALIDDNSEEKKKDDRERRDFEARMDRLRDELLEHGLKESTRQAYGIELVDVRLRRFNHPPAVRAAIFDRIKSERKKKADEYVSEGDKLKKEILSLADREARDTLTKARSEAELQRKQAEVKGDEIRNEAHAKDPDFYAFLQKLKTYQTILGDTRDVLLLSSKHELFDMLLKPPKANGTEPPKPGRRERQSGEDGRAVTMRRFLLVVLGLLLVAYLLTGVVQIRSDERAVVRRFGRVVATPQPGLWVGFPWGIDRVECVKVDQVRRVPVGYQPDADEPGGGTPPGQLLTGDHNLVNIQVVIDYTVRPEPEQIDNFVIQADRADGLVARAAEASLAEWVAGRGVDEVLLTSKVALPSWLVRQTQDRLAPIASACRSSRPACRICCRRRTSAATSTT